MALHPSGRQLASLTWLQLVVTVSLGACNAAPPGMPDDAGSPFAADAGGNESIDAGGENMDDGGAGNVDATDAGSVDAAPPDVIAMCGARPTSLDEWETCYRKRVCELTLNCGRMNLYTDVQECMALGNAVSGGQLDYEVRERSRAIEARRAFLDEDAFIQCLVDITPSRCLGVRFSSACAAKFGGTIPDHQSCYNDIECQSPGARCTTDSCDNACCLGVCEPRRKLGEVCLTSAECEPGLPCSLNSRCVSGDIGTSCSDSGDCDPDKFCDPVKHVCSADLPEGAPCLLNTQCGGETSCVGNRLGGDPPRCRRVSVVNDACDFLCLGNLYCDVSSTTGLGVCRSLPKHGESCGQFLPCIGMNEICEDGTCVTLPGVDQPCLAGVCRPGLFCSDQRDPANSTCHQPLADGAGECSRPEQCQSHICDSSMTGQCQSWLPTCP